MRCHTDRAGRLKWNYLGKRRCDRRRISRNPAPVAPAAVRESRELHLDEQRSSWHDVGASIDVAVRKTTDDEVAKVVDDDHRVLSELIESGAVRPGLIVLEPNAGRTLQT